LLPADVTAREADRTFEDAKRPTRQLGRVLKPLRDDYDLVVLDCPPSLSLLSENVFELANLLLLPLLPAPLSLRTLEQLIDFLRSFDGRRPDVCGFFSMVDGRKRMHADALASRPAAVLDAVVPAVSSVERMAVTRAPVIVTEPRGRAAVAYRALWDEVQPRLDA
jgi:cellulose biosynthesis protein BcsQ